MQQVVVLLFSLVALSLASQSYLIAVASNCSIVTIDVGSGQYKVVANIEPSECPSDPMDSISAAAVDPEAQEYYLQMFYDETRGAIYTYSLKTGKLLRTYILPGMPSNPRYDPILKKFIGMMFNAIVAYDSRSYTEIVELKPPMEGIQVDTAALDGSKHLYYYFNLTITGSDLVTVDIANKKILSTVTLDKAGEDNVQYLWFNYPQAPALLGINSWKSIDRIDTMTGRTVPIGPIAYAAFQTGVFDPLTQSMTFLGTDGKQHSFLVTVRNGKVVNAPLMPYHLNDLPGGITYYTI